ncbi:hypothetical protein ATI45_1190 [Marinobacter sp. LV10MA510-1]|uniref:hypothetical protein n=2 Tax=unclassified Marinobacter TaxID=83889 RepID=UPI000BF4DA90|nr:hypothetical protein [Marinobacter sp. LV10R520-4]PFG08858.1 hypothetical protein ATI45_1190 [Marinobacter sp. LV10MA510-1]PFG54724.1 hypothetical protein ATG98_4019 [Marinobacter sp. LV10R520-4]
MFALRSLAIATIVLAVTGCASGPVAQDRSGLPAWTTKTQFVDAAASHQVFVGIGQASIEPEAKRRARSDAQAQYIRAVGGTVVTSQRIRESGKSDSDGISQRSVSSERYTGSTSSALLHSTQSEYVVYRDEGSITVYVRMSVPIDVLKDAREEVKRSHEQAIMRKLEAYKLAKESRQGDVDGTVYAFVVGKSSSDRQSGMSAISVERTARERARHDAKVSATEQIHGLNAKSATVQSGSRSNWSYTTSSGTVRSEVIAERIWWEGNTAVAESYVLGWKNLE